MPRPPQLIIPSHRLGCGRPPYTREDTLREILQNILPIKIALVQLLSLPSHT
jgi:hypothetical protein